MKTCYIVQRCMASKGDPRPGRSSDISMQNRWKASELDITSRDWLREPRDMSPIYHPSQILQSDFIEDFL